jgi:hypothetical protein
MEARVCKSCTDYNRLSFGTPIAVTVGLPASTNSPHYPRVDTNGTLWFTVVETQMQGMPTTIATANLNSFPTWGTASALMTAGALGPLPIDDGAALAPFFQGGAMITGGAVLYDAPSTPTTRQVQERAGGTAVTLSLPGDSGVTSQHSIAVATGLQPVRVFWINVGTTSALMTATPGNGQPAPVTITLPTNEKVGDVDDPWVTADGQLLFFTSHLQSEAVTNTHLYYARMVTSGPSAGQQSNASTAARVFPIDMNGDTEPSLTPDACAILFTRGGAFLAALRD